MDCTFNLLFHLFFSAQRPNLKSMCCAKKFRHGAKIISHLQRVRRRLWSATAPVLKPSARHYLPLIVANFIGGIPYDPVRPSVCRSVGWSVCMSVLKGGKLHFHAPIGELYSTMSHKTNELWLNFFMDAEGSILFKTKQNKKDYEVIPFVWWYIRELIFVKYSPGQKKRERERKKKER